MKKEKFVREMNSNVKKLSKEIEEIKDQGAEENYMDDFREEIRTLEAQRDSLKKSYRHLKNLADASWEETKLVFKRSFLSLKYKIQDLIN